jgi:hypothetical protein
VRRWSEQEAEQAGDLIVVEDFFAPLYSPINLGRSGNGREILSSIPFDKQTILDSLITLHTLNSVERLFASSFLAIT